MALIFHPSSNESAIGIITRALELDPKAGIELTAKNLIVRFSNRAVAESWKTERDKANLPTKWFSSRYHQKESSEDFSRLQNQVDYLTQEVNALTATVSALKLSLVKPPEVAEEVVEEVAEEVVEEVKPKKTRGRPKKA